MKFRPCIDIHNGKVKQIVGGSLQDEGDQARENFVAEKNADFYADFYAQDGVTGGHIILLNPESSPYYQDTKDQAFLALKTRPGMFQVGGGINPANAESFLDAGASAVIVTSYVFKDGRINFENLKKMVAAVGKEHLVLDLSCRKQGDEFRIVTDRWQKFTDVALTRETLDQLSESCCEFLVHAADVEGKASGPQREVVSLLGEWQGIPTTYAGGIGSFADLQTLRDLGQNHVDVTVGSALDLFGGSMSYRDILKFCAD